MIAAADSAKLFGGHRFQIADRFNFPRRVVKQIMFNPRFTFASNAERNVVNHVVHDLVDLRRDFLPLGIGQDGEITASDVEANTAERDFVFVGNHAADRLRITFVAVGAKHAAFAAGRYAGLDLLDRRRVVLAEDFCFGFHR